MSVQSSFKVGVPSFSEAGQYCFDLIGGSGNYSLELFSGAEDFFSLEAFTMSQSCEVEELIADVLNSNDYYPFGMVMPGRSYQGSDGYRYGFQGQEQDPEVNGGRNSINYKYRMHDPRIGRFLSVDPLAPDYPHNSPYAFSENRVVDGVELEGLEYITIHHYPGRIRFKMFYLMSDDVVKNKYKGTASSALYSVPFGPEGRGVKHVFYDVSGKVTDITWEMRQQGFKGTFGNHGLFSGNGSITFSGENLKDWFMGVQPIDYSDAIAKRHDIDYSEFQDENYLNFVEDVRTLEADRDMVGRIKMALNPLISNSSIPGIEEPVRKSMSSEAIASLNGQLMMISALATYKQWKIDNGYESKLYSEIGDQFEEEHNVVAEIVKQALNEANKNE